MNHAVALKDALDRSVADLRAAIGSKQPKVGLILGSGLGGFADSLADKIVVPFAKVSGFPTVTVAGHSGNVVYGRAHKAEVLALQGRVHSYEGHSLSEVAFLARTLIWAGCKTLIITNAAGGVDATMKPGELVIIKDHLNLMGGSPLIGPNDESVGPRFPDMTRAYDAELRKICQAAAQSLGMKLREGVYAGLSGPAYETPAEVRMVRALGGDLVGMSTVPEVIAAAHMGARVLGISCVTNLAAGITDQPLSHEEVTETGKQVRGQFTQLLNAVLERLS